MVVNPDFLCQKCPFCGSKKVICKTERVENKELKNLPLCRVLNKLFPQKRKVCFCKECKERWECKREPFVFY